MGLLPFIMPVGHRGANLRLIHLRFPIQPVLQAGILGDPLKKRVVSSPFFGRKAGRRRIMMADKAILRRTNQARTVYRPMVDMAHIEIFQRIIPQVGKGHFDPYG
ncbi:hypothetical protein SDC9_165599 [bioreactor metagenome]|uniref:Uncharacterized protein n=1 Tax=bioreactor metagenome TaxID=1076179 RepID=A0A645FX54_9ZZZZ